MAVDREAIVDGTLAHSIQRDAFRPEKEKLVSMNKYYISHLRPLLGNYYRAQVPVDNSSAPVWHPMTNQAVLNVGTNFVVETNVTGNVFLPQNPESFAYDLDGNLTNDGRWIYTWDAVRSPIRIRQFRCIPKGKPVVITNCRLALYLQLLCGNKAF